MNRNSRWARALVALGLVTSSAGVALLTTVPAASAAGELHSYVCKYKVTPGGGEVLQSGQNPIWPSNSALGVETVEPGQKFNDAQGFSIALLDPQYLNITEQVKPEPSVDLCKEAPKEAIPAAPSFVEPTCDAEADVVLPTLEEGVAEYQVTGTVGPGEEVTVTAIAADGYAFAEGTVTSWTYTFAAAPTDAECNPAREATPVEPAYTEPSCDTAASLALPTTEGVEYSVEGTPAPGETVTITATALEGFVLIGQSVFEHTFATVDEDCDPPREATAVEPSYTEADCGVAAGLTLPTTEGVEYDVAGTVAPGQTVTVTATALEGFVLAGQTVFEHTFSGIGGVCGPIVTPPDNDTPVVTPPVVAGPKGPQVVTPTVVRAGVLDEVAGVSASVSESMRLVGTGLTGVGLVLMLGGGAAWLRRDGGQA